VKYKNIALGDVAKFIRGITFSPNDLVEENGVNVVGCMRTKNVQKDLDTNDVWKLLDNHIKNEDQYLIEGDLLVSTANSWNLVGKACWVPDLKYKCTFGGFISALRANINLLDKKYLYHWFTSDQTQELLRSFGNKTTNISNLNIKRANNLLIPLPPLAEQKRIAVILDKAELIKSKRELVIEKLDSLAQSIFVDMFLNNPIYESQSISDICTLVTDGTHYTPKDIGVGIPFLTVRNMSEEGLDFKGCSFISRADFDEAKSGNCAPKINDVLFSKDGTVGKVHVVEEPNEFAVLSSIAILRPNENKVLSQYLGYALRSSQILDSAISKKTGAAIRRIILSNLKSIQIPIPPIEKQRIFLQKISELHQIKTKSKLDLRRLNDLFISIQSQAFSGQL
jgi:type I restriction enzyme S subunit